MIYRQRFLAAVIVLVSASLAGIPTVESADRAVASGDRFVKQVKPLLELKCLQCHGPDKQKGKLRLDSREAVLKGGASGPAIVSGNPDASLLIQAVRHAHKDLQMPPKEKLSDEQIASLAAWITDGAVWPALAPGTTAKAAKQRLGDAWSDPDNPIVKVFNGQRLDLWSFKKPVRVELPALKGQTWVRTPIDRFVLAKLEAAGLRPSSEADRRTLVRRLYFDLVGLPPTPEEMDGVLHDQANDWYEKLVDKLLTSPHYGERSARQWLDIVRYADTNGFERDEYRPNAWRYRDYVVRSLNQDKPYDQFIREQLAGDEMPEGEPGALAPGADRIVATGYLRLGTYDSTRGLFAEDKKGHDELMADLVTTTGSAFLGLTMACCQCHNHKYDPISQADHYRLRAFFAAVRFRDDVPVASPEELERINAHNAALDEQSKPLQQEIAALLADVKTQLAEERQAKFPPEIVELLKTNEADRDDATKKQLKPYRDKLNVSDKDAAAALKDDAKKHHAELEKKTAELNKRKRTPDKALAMSDSGASAPATHLFFQGDFTQPREAVPPGFLSALDPNPAKIAPPNPSTTGRRTALANWIVSPDNPLTARVMVNRLWQRHFGKGIVATPNDFGFGGARPTHPELLDWLAVEFAEKNWSTKHIHRLIVLSAAYRQASVDDPQRRLLDAENALFWRQNPRRLDAETLRDAMLSVSGLLLPYQGGRPLWPPVPDDILKAQPGILEALEGHDSGRKQGWYSDPVEKTDVRTIYLIQKRVLPLPFLQSFDLPDTTCSCGRRNVTTVAPQALTLLNSPTAFRMAGAFADRVAKEAGDDSAKRAERALSLAVGRRPDGAEKLIALKLLERHTELYARQAKPGPEMPERRALVDLCRAFLNLNEFVYID